MEFRHIRYFLVLSEELHFRRASDKLFIAQPALSRQIKDLEDELGVTLFKRDRRNVSLTLAGKYLQDEGYKLLKHVETIQSSISEVGSTLSGLVNIGYIGSAMNAILPDLIRQIGIKLPKVKTNLVEETSQNLWNALIDRKVDVIFSRRVDENASILSHKTLEEPTVLAVSKDNQWSVGESSKVHDLKDVPFILFPRKAGPSFRDQIIRICSSHGFYPKITHESIYGNSILRLVEKDLGISILPKSLIKGYSLNIEAFELKDINIPVSLYVSCRKDENDEVVKAIMEMVVQDFRIV